MALEMCVRPQSGAERRSKHVYNSAVELLGDLCPTPTLKGLSRIVMIEIRKKAVLNGMVL
jgi:hypothetical protein